MWMNGGEMRVRLPPVAGGTARCSCGSTGVPNCNGNCNGIFTAEDAKDAKDCFSRHRVPTPAPHHGQRRVAFVNCSWPGRRVGSTEGRSRRSGDSNGLGV